MIPPLPGADYPPQVGSFTPSEQALLSPFDGFDSMSDLPPETRAVSAPEIQAVLEAESTGLPFVQWRADDGGHHVRVLGPDLWRVTVGRRSESDIALVWDAEVSRTHALLEWTGGEWVIVDDGMSTNGSFVNGNRVIGRQRLHDRDRLCFGETIVVYREMREVEHSESTARALQGVATVPLTPTQRKVLIALCRPVLESRLSSPATNKQIADEVFLSVDAVKAHLRALFERFSLDDLPQNEKRARLAKQALADGVLSPHEF